MIELESEIWRQLNHAYGSASDIPDLLSQLSDYPSNAVSETEPFFSLWSALCHQGDSYTASYAALPHIVDAALRNPDKISYDYLLLPTAIEISRRSGKGPELSNDLRKSYEQSIKKLARIVGALDLSRVDATWATVSAAAVAVSAGQPKLADAILAMEGEVIDEFMEWVENR